MEPVGGQCMKYNEGIPWVWTQSTSTIRLFFILIKSTHKGLQIMYIVMTHWMSRMRKRFFLLLLFSVTLELLDTSVKQGKGKKCMQNEKEENCFIMQNTWVATRKKSWNLRRKQINRIVEQHIYFASLHELRLKYK